MSTQNLPHEIFQLIFQHLHRPTVYQCVFVCKSWNVAATHAYYKDFVLTGDMITLLQQKLELYYNNQIDDLPQLTTHGALIRSIKIRKDRPKNNRLTGKELSTVLSYMPNIKRIDLNETAKYCHYLQKLQNSRNHAVDLNHLEGISIADKLSPIKRSGMKEYFTTCYKYRDILEYLYFTQIGRRYNMQGRTGDYLYFLPDFKNLTQLHIDNNTYRNFLLCPIFKACPNLIDFTYKSIYSIIDIDTAGEFESLATTKKTTEGRNVAGADTIHKSAEDSNSTAILITTNSLLLRQQQQNYFHKHYCGNLKTIHFSVPYINMKCLMFYVPLYLDKLELRMDDKLLDLWLEENDMETMMQFTKLLSCINNVDIAMGKYNYYNNYLFNYGRPVFSKRPEMDMTMEKRFDRYWSFIGALACGRSFKIYFTLCLYEDGAREPKIRFKFDVSNRHNRLDLRYALHVKDCIYNKTGVMEVPPFLPAAASENKASRRTMELPAIHSFDINIQDGMYTYYFLYDRKLNVIDILEYIVLNCHHLFNISVRTLTESYYFKSKSNKGTLTTTTSDNMTQCRLERVEFLPEIFNILNNTFRNIKRMYLDNCCFSADECYNYHWDFTGIKDMDNLKLDMQNLNTNRTRLHIFFQIEFTGSNGEEDVKYYQLNKKSLSGERLVPTTSRYINNYNRVKSLKTTVFFIKFNKINSITLLLDKPDDTETMAIN